MSTLKELTDKNLWYLDKPNEQMLVFHGVVSLDDAAAELEAMQTELNRLDEANSHLAVKCGQQDRRIEACKKLIEKWNREAEEAVPEEYASRGLVYKYLKLDNAARGLSNCADELAAALKDE